MAILWAATDSSDLYLCLSGRKRGGGKKRLQFPVMSPRCKTNPGEGQGAAAFLRELDTDDSWPTTSECLFELSHLGKFDFAAAETTKCAPISTRDREEVRVQRVSLHDVITWVVTLVFLFHLSVW